MEKLELRPYQKECINAVPERGRFLIQMATGLGKCFARGTEILMFDGTIKKVEDIAVGNLLMGPDSTPRTVVSLSTGREQMYEIKQNKKRSYTVNESHILTLQITGVSNLRVKNINDSLGQKHGTGDIVNISVRDFLNCSPTFKHVAKGYSAAIDFPPINPTPEYYDPYFLGLWLGDGNSRSLLITTENLEIVEYLNIFAKTHGYELIKRNNCNCGNASEYFLKNTKHDAYMRKYFRKKLFLNKHIPFEFKVASRDVRLKLLAGLLDTDGYLHKQDSSTFEFCSKYKQMVEDVAFIVRSLGMSAREFSRHNNKYNQDYYYCCIWGNTSEIPTLIKYKQAKNNSNKNNLLTGIEVVPVGEGEYFGFELNGNDRRFLLSDFTVVHNTVCFSRIPRKGKVLILSHRDELVRQPIKYYDVPVGIEQGINKSNGEEIVSASVQSLVRRVNRFTRDEFDMVIVDEAHHASANSYQKIIEHFNPRLLLGFTATPNRADGTGLDKIFDDIIFERDLEWGIKNGYLSDIYALRIDIGYDLRNVASKLGDYAQDELEKAVNIESANKAIADAYHKYAKGQTLIFAVSVEHAKNIAKAIPGAEYVVGGEKREEKLERFKEGKLRCLVNCMIFTEGTDLPNIETIIMARPTQSNVLYTQAVGRGTRLYPGKEELTLIDCVGASRLNLCTAPTLLGLDPQIMDDYDLPQAASIFDIPDMMERLMDEPKYWIRNAQIVDLWAKGRKYNLHGVNWFRTAKGYLVLGKPKVKLPPPDKLGRMFWNGKKVAYQRVLDEVYQSLCNNYADSRSLWDKKLANKWGEYRATDRQLSLVHNFMPGHSTEGMTKAEAGAIITRMFLGREL